MEKSCQIQVAGGKMKYFRDLPKDLEDGPSQCSTPDGWVGLTGAQQHRVVGNGANGRRCGKKVVQISVGNTAKLLLEVSTLGLRHAGRH